METERDKDKQTERQGERIIGGGGDVAAALVAPIAPLDSRNTSRDPAAPSVTVVNNRAPQI